MLAYLKHCLVAARSKLTVYLAPTPLLIEYFPNWVHDYWAQLEQAVPHLAVYHQAVAIAAVLATCWARVRRDAKAAMQAAKGNQP